MAEGGIVLAMTIEPAGGQTSGLAQGPVVSTPESRMALQNIAAHQKSGLSGVVTLKAEELFAMARKSSLWPLTFGLCVLRH